VRPSGPHSLPNVSAVLERVIPPEVNISTTLINDVYTPEMISTMGNVLQRTRGALSVAFATEGFSIKKWFNKTRKCENIDGNELNSDSNTFFVERQNSLMLPKNVSYIDSLFLYDTESKRMCSTSAISRGAVVPVNSSGMTSVWRNLRNSVFLGAFWHLDKNNSDVSCGQLHYSRETDRCRSAGSPSGDCILLLSHTSAKRRKILLDLLIYTR
jgi:hypothetical protein